MRQVTGLRRNGRLLAESKAIANSFTTAPTSHRQTLIDTAVRNLKGAGIWQTLDLLYLLAAADSQAARINWVNPSANTLTEVNSPTFNADRGFTGDGATMGLNTTKTPVNAQQNNVHLAAVALTHGTSSNADVSMANGATTTRCQVRARNLTSSLIRTSNNSTNISATTGANVPVMVLGNRVDSANQSIYINGVADGTGAATSSAISGMTQFCVLYNNLSTPLYSDRQIAFASSGGALTDAQIAAYYTIINAYLAAVGAV